MDIEEILYTFEDDYNPSSMVPGPRNMYNQGQLVRPNNDGSRPGYNGKKEVLSKTKFIELITKNSDKTYNEFVEILNKDYTAAGGKPFTKGIIADRARAYDLSGTLSKKEPQGRSEESKEQRRIAENKRYYERKKTEEGRAKQKKYRLNAKAKEYLNLGIDPPASTPQEALWKDAVTSAKKNKDGNGRFSFKSGYKKSMSRKDFFSNKIKIVDNVTGKTFNYNNYKSFINKNAKSFDINGYDDAIRPYKQKDFVNKTPGLRNSVNSALIPNYAKGNKTNAFTVQHNVGRQKNPLKVSLAFYDENTKEYYARDNFEKAWEKSKKSKTPLADRKKAFNIFKTEIDKLNVVSQPSMIKRNRSFGKELDLTEGLKIAKKKGAKIPYGTFKKLAAALEKLGCGKSAGGRILMSNGGATLTDCAIKGREVLEKGLKNGFEKGAQGDLARKILGTGKFLKDAVSLRGLFGPAALAFTVAAEAGIVGYDMLSSGKSFREAVGDSVFNYMLGDKTKINPEEEFIKRLKNIPGSPGQGFRGFTDEDINKMLVFKSKLKDMETGFSNYSDLINVNEKIKENTKNQQVNPELFPDQAFQLEAEKDRIQADIRDYNKVGTPRNVTDYMISDEGIKGGDALARGTLLAKENQLLGVNPTSRRGIESLEKDLIDTRFNLQQMNNPTKYNKNAKYFMSLPKSEQSKLMSYENMLDPFREKFMSKPKSEQSRIMSYGYKEGGIASLNVNKK